MFPARTGGEKEPSMKAKTQKTRMERDSMGEIEVPADALWGASTQRAILNFPANLERIRTGQLGNREKQGLRCLPGPETAVSGSDTCGLDGQEPAESRSFLGLFPPTRPKSPRRKTKWRCGQSIANPSLCRIP